MYLKKLVRGTDSDIGDALLRLENAILDETRMVTAEALTGIHTLHEIVEDRMRGMENKLHDGQERISGVN